MDFATTGQGGFHSRTSEAATRRAAQRRDTAHERKAPEKPHNYSSRSKACGAPCSSPFAIGIFVLVLLCLASNAGARNKHWPYLGNSRLLMVAGETLDTTTAPSVLHERTGGRRGEIDNATYAQYYVQMKPDADQQDLHRVSSRAYLLFHAQFQHDDMMLCCAGDRQCIHGIRAKQCIYCAGLGSHSTEHRKHGGCAVDWQARVAPQGVAVSRR